MARTQQREMVTVQMLMFHKRNNAGEVCSFPRQEAEQLITKGIAKLHAPQMVTKAAEPKAETPTPEPEVVTEEPKAEEQPPKKRRGRKPKAKPTDATAE